MLVKVWLHNHQSWEIWESYLTNFLIFDDYITTTCNSTYFHIRNINEIRNFLSHDACSNIIHALISCRLDYCNYIMYNVPSSKTDRLQIMRAQLDKITAKGTYYPSSKLMIESYIKCWCSHINRITILYRLIYVNWLTKRESCEYSLGNWLSSAYSAAN